MTQSLDRHIEYLPLDDIAPAPRNPKRHNIPAVRTSISRFGFATPALRDERTGRLVVGHGRTEALRAMRDAGEDPPAGVQVDAAGAWLVPVVCGWASRSDAEAEAYLVADNRHTELGGWDDSELANLLSDLADTDVELLTISGFDATDLADLLADADTNHPDGDGAPVHTERGKSLAERFGVPPFTVLDARQGYWQERKRTWLALGLDSGSGRDEALTGGFANAATVKQAYGSGGAEAAPLPSWAGTSLFDPVLCELLVRWYSNTGARVLDPFAGGSVRGLVAARLGRDYTGIDLRPEQVAANEAQAAEWMTRGLLGAAAGTEQPNRGPDDLTPVEQHGGHLVKRDDLFRYAGGVGGKVRTCLTLARNATRGLVTAGSRQSPQVNIVAGIAATLGLPCRVHVPAAKGGLTPELAAAQAAGAEIIEHRPGYNTVIVARARDDAKERGWTEIPFGMECREAVQATAAQVGNLPADVRRIVVPVGSGMSLAGILTGLTRGGVDTPVLGVMVGADPAERLDAYAPRGWRDRVTLVASPMDYHQHAPVRTLGDLHLDPVYEAKCLPFLEPGDLLWVVGCRETAVEHTPGTSRWVTGDSRNLRDLVPAGDAYDLMLTCPPYYDLEVYSNDPADLSRAGDYDAFLKDYGACLAAATDRMRPDAFAAIVTGPVRDRRGYILDLPSDTTRIMETLGWRLYQDAILVTQLATASIRASRSFALRKLTRTHQAVAVYHRGDIGAVRSWASAEVGDMGEDDTE